MPAFPANSRQALVLAAVILVASSTSHGQPSDQLNRFGDQSDRATDETPPSLPLAPVNESQEYDAEPLPLEEGPIHEAFASPIGEVGSAQGDSFEVLVRKTPPQPVRELPPDQRPEGKNVEWIPGYWMWQAERDDFVWVSGVWRRIPPKRKWVPGSWVEVRDGYGWSPGFWAESNAVEVAYLPQPPGSLESGPSSPAPSDNQLWVPGCWVYRNNDYYWRPGHWYEAQPNWVWVPAYYNYTPRGCLYVSGYWDRPLSRRGVLYSPVYWNSNYYLRSGYTYRPRSIIDTALLLTNLFVNPSRGHYYYGAYGPRYRDRGYYSWYAYSTRGPRYHDPLYDYYRTTQRVPGGRSFDDLRLQYERYDRGQDFSQATAVLEFLWPPFLPR